MQCYLLRGKKLALPTFYILFMEQIGRMSSFRRCRGNAPRNAFSIEIFLGILDIHVNMILDIHVNMRAGVFFLSERW